MRLITKRAEPRSVQAARLARQRYAEGPKQDIREALVAEQRGLPPDGLNDELVASYEAAFNRS